MFLLLMQFLILHIDKLVGKGLPFLLVSELILSSLAYMAVLAVPMSVLVSNLMVFGKLAETNEFTALKMSGIPAIRILIPSMLFGSILVLVMLWFSNRILPEANLRARALFIDIRLKKPGFDLKENTFYNGIAGYVFRVRTINQETDSLYDITLVQEANSKKDFVIARAEKGILRSENDNNTLTLLLFNGATTRVMPEHSIYPRKVETTEFQKYRISFDLSELAFSRSNPGKQRRTDRTMSYNALSAFIDSVFSEIAIRDDDFSETKVSFLIQPKPHKPVKPYSLFRIIDPENRGAVLDSLPALALETAAMPVFRVAGEQYDLVFRAVRDLKRTITEYESHLVNRKWMLQNAARYEVERQKKIALPVACVIFVLIGAPLGLLTRKGSLGNAATIAAILFTFYWISLIQGEKLADRLFVSPITGIWFGNGCMTLGGLLLLFHLQTDGLWRRRKAHE